MERIYCKADRWRGRTEARPPDFCAGPSAHCSLLSCAQSCPLVACTRRASGPSWFTGLLLATRCGHSPRLERTGSWGCSIKGTRLRVEKQEEGENRVESDALWNFWPFLNSGKRKNDRTYSKYVKRIRGSLLFT